MAYIIGNRAHNVGKGPRVAGRITQRFIQLGKMLFDCILVAENLDDLLPFDHLFYIAIYLSQGPLLLDEEVSGFPADHFYQLEQNQQQQHG